MVAEWRMTRCECARLTFAEMAEIALREGIRDLELLCRRTGGGTTCTACVGDLARFLRDHSPAAAVAR
jgi:bacterioferritin-associated ferredoxin